MIVSFIVVVWCSLNEGLRMMILESIDGCQSGRMKAKKELCLGLLDGLKGLCEDCLKGLKGRLYEGCFGWLNEVLKGVAV